MIILSTRNKKIKVNNKYKKKQIFILCLILISVSSLVTIFARYITNSVQSFFVRSKDFYFYSDKLSEDISTFQIENWSGVDEYTITVNMNSRKNNIKVVSYDIEYKIKYKCITNNAICQLNKTEGIIYANTNSDFFNLTITPNTELDTGEKVVVEIEATSTSRYSKTLKGIFTLVVGKEKLSYQITDNEQNPYMDLRITNTLSYYIVDNPFDNYVSGQKIDTDTYLSLTDENKNKCYSSIVTINFDPRKILLDVTNENYVNAKNIKTTTINQYTYINSITIGIDAISSVDIRFYKVDVSKNYTYPNIDNVSIVNVTSE